MSHMIFMSHWYKDLFIPPTIYMYIPHATKLVQPVRGEKLLTPIYHCLTSEAGVDKAFVLRENNDQDLKLDFLDPWNNLIPYPKERIAEIGSVEPRSYKKLAHDMFMSILSVSGRGYKTIGASFGESDPQFNS